MKHVITDATKLASSVAAFKRKIAALAHRKQSIEWAFPNGARAICTTYSVSTALGELLVAIPEKWEGRHAHLFVLNHKGGLLSPDVEINIPDGLDRQVSGAYVQHDKETLICHRGGFTAYRGKIPKQYSLAYFKSWLTPVDDDDKAASFISVTSLESISLANDIAEFVSAVSEMKALFKAEQQDPSPDPRSKKWRDGAEFEGLKTTGKPSRPKDYDYLHGPLCNALRRQLKRLVQGSPTVEILSNDHIDVAIVNTSSDVAVAIFEVKTASSLSAQLYSAHGQLAYYKHKYGEASTTLFLVLPAQAEKQMSSLDFFVSAGIQVIYGENETFVTSSGQSFSEAVARSLRP